MIAKGHDFPNVTLVGVLAADAILNFSDFRATERTFQLLTQVAGRSGRGEDAGIVVIQTYNPDHYSITAAKNHDYEGFYRQEMVARKALRYPPFLNIGVFVLTGLKDAAVRAAADALCRELAKTAPERCVILEPARPPLAKLKERYRWRFIIKHEDEAALENAAQAVYSAFYGQKYPAGVDISFDVNPFSLM
jgi:primosomal protein N' (replication factor Y)